MKEIVLMGTGIQAEKFVYEFGEYYDIKYVLDFNPTKDKFLNKYDVYSPTVELCSKYFVVVACDYYRSKIIPFFTQMGKEEFVDYVWCEWNEKKVVVLNANCYGPQIKKYLQNDSDFSKEYCFYPIPPICENKLGTIDKHIMSKCSVFIHQDIREDNAYGYKLSDKYLLDLLPSNAISITVPNLVGFGKAFYPQSVSSNPNSRPHPNSKTGLFPHADKLIDELVQQGKTRNEIINICRSGGNFNKNDVQTSLNVNYRKYKEREKYWDIKVLDMIMDLYRDVQVFYDMVHPANFIMRKICEEVMGKVGIHKNLELLGNGINTFEIPLYPEIREHLSLSWGGWNHIIRKDSACKLIQGDMNMEEFIKEYLFWCYPNQYV